MNQEIKTKWLQALRSGQYKQGVGALKRTTAEGSSFCCLGVLCDVIKEDLGIDWHLQQPVPTNESFNGNSVGLETPIRMYCGLSHTGNLVTMNDDEQASFEQIANYIEDNL